MPPANPTGPPGAGFVSRLLAFGIDNGMVALSAQAGLWFLSSLQQAFLGWRDWSLNLAGLLPFMLPPLAAAYNVVCWWLLGYTPGKWFLGLRVVSTRGARLTLLQCLVRFAGYFVSAIPFYFGFWIVLRSPGREAWHDRLAGTRVVYASRET